MPPRGAKWLLPIDAGAQPVKVFVGYQAVKPVPGSLRGCERRGIQKLGKSKTRPGPVKGPLHQVRAHRILQDVPDHGEKMRVLLNGKTLEAALPHMPMTVVVPMIASHMAGHPPLHKRAERCAPGGLEDEMEMIGHQAEGENFNGMSGFGRGEQVQEGPIVSIRMEHRGAAIAPIEDMEGVTGEVTAWNPGHGGKIT